jgi:Protein of unknown function (DUF2855)
MTAQTQHAITQHTTTGQRLFIARNDLHRLQVGPDPDAPAARPLQAGQARMAIDHFALTANNITYAAVGELMKYWQFFPAPDAAWGCLPVWGFATVAESLCDGLAVGQRVYGYWPAGTHLVVQPGRTGAQGFVDTSEHRQALAAVYNQYSFCDADPAWVAAANSTTGAEARAHFEGLQAVLRPLFMTAFLIDDLLADNQFFGAQQLLLSSASSKTAYATAFFLRQRLGTPGHPAVVGLTSPGNLAYTQALGCYDQVLTYEQLAQLPANTASVYVDFTGSVDLRRQVHTHFANQLRFSSSIGVTHWSDMGPSGSLPGPKPQLFFAPAQAAKRSEPPPTGWGRSGLQQRLGQAWGSFVAQVQQAQPPWVHITQHSGADALQAAYLSLLNGKADPRQGLMLRL